MTRTVPDLTLGLAQLRASCPRGLGAECACAARIEASGDVEHLAFMLDGGTISFTFGLPLLTLADLMMGMLIVSNMNQGDGLRELPQLEDADLLAEERALVGEDLLEDEFPDGMLDGLTDAQVRDIIIDAFPPEPKADVMDDLRSLAELPFDLVAINDDGQERDLYGQLPEHVLQPA